MRLSRRSVGSPALSIQVRAQPAFQSDYLVVREAILRKDGRASAWHYVDHPGCALVVPFTHTRSLVLVRAFRVALGRTCLELPGGRIEEGEPPERAAQRELAEEAGGSAEQLIPLGQTFASPGTSNEVVHMFLGVGVTIDESRLDVSEIEEIVEVPQADVSQLIADNSIEDSASALAVMLAWNRQNR